MIVGVFTSTMREDKATHLKAFAKGVNAMEGCAFIHDKPTYRKCDVAVMLGSPTTDEHPYNKAKQEIIDNHEGKILHIDGQVMRSFMKTKYYRVYYQQDVFHNRFATNDRFYKLHLNIKPWRKKGDHILLCLQRKNGWAMKDKDPIEYGIETIQEIREYTDRKIVVRQHPTNNITTEFDDFDNVTISNFEKGYNLNKDLKNAWAMVTYNSSAAIDPIILGVPLFLGDTDCMAIDMANRNLRDIENPTIPDRTQWLNDLSYSIWTIPEMENGDVWAIYR